MRLPIPILLAVALAAAGCGDAPSEKPQLPELGKVLPELPTPPNGRLVGRSGSADALQLTFRAAMASDQIADYYRSVLSQGQWRLVSDHRDGDAVVLYAERNGPPMWVRIWQPDSLQAYGETLVEIAGGVPDTTATVGRPPRRDSAPRKPVE